VQTVEPWAPPALWTDMSVATLNQILSKIDAGLENGDKYTDAPASRDKAAWKIVTQFAPQKSEGQARDIIKAWVKNGVAVRSGSRISRRAMLPRLAVKSGMHSWRFHRMATSKGIRRQAFLAPPARLELSEWIEECVRLPRARARCPAR
jgi:hypothetical protein